MIVFMLHIFLHLFSNAYFLHVSTDEFFIFFFNKDDDRNVQEDGEIQGFYQELTAPRAPRAMIGSGGCGMNV